MSKFYAFSSSVWSGCKGHAFLFAVPKPLHPASSGPWFSFPESLGDSLKNSPMPFCHFGVGRTHTGFPPAYLFSAFLDEHDEEFVTKVEEPSTFLGAREATTAKRGKGSHSEEAGELRPPEPCSTSSSLAWSRVIHSSRITLPGLRSFLEVRAWSPPPSWTRLGAATGVSIPGTGCLGNP